MFLKYLLLCCHKQKSILLYGNGDKPSYCTPALVWYCLSIMVSQIISNSNVCSTDCLLNNSNNNEITTLLAFCEWNPQWESTSHWWIPLTKRPVMWKVFPCHVLSPWEGDHTHGDFMKYGQGRHSAQWGTALIISLDQDDSDLVDENFKSIFLNENLNI